MTKSTLPAILQHLDELTYAEMKRLKHTVDRYVAMNQVGEIITQREESVCECPHCSSPDFSRWVFTKQGLQRYKCKDCSRTFNPLNGSPLHRMRKGDKWIKYSKLMWQGAPLRRCAKEVGVSLRTAFRWRHVLLSKPNNALIAPLSGVIEADETFINKSLKGKKLPLSEQLSRRPQTPILIAMNRDGAIIHEVVERNTKENISNFLRPMITDGSVLCTDGNLSYLSVVKDRYIDHKRVVAIDNVRVIDGVYHIQNLNNYIMRLKAWLSRFKGVSIDYLPNYLSWFRFMDQNEETDQKWLHYALD